MLLVPRLSDAMGSISIKRPQRVTWSVIKNHSLTNLPKAIVPETLSIWTFTIEPFVVPGT